jgi:hypothetical protein
MCSLFVRVILGCKAEKLLFSDAAGAACLVMNTVLMGVAAAPGHEHGADGRGCSDGT